MNRQIQRNILISSQSYLVRFLHNFLTSNGLYSQFFIPWLLGLRIFLKIFFISLFYCFRLVLMSYFPSGFWSRLLTRILADDCVVEIVRNYFIIPEEVRQDPMLNKIYVENKPEWVCWQTGLELRYLEAPLFSMKQVLPKVASLFDYHGMKMMLNQEDNWSDIDTATSSILELSLPQDTVVIKRPIFDQDDENSVGYYQAIVLDPNPKAVIFDCFFLIFSIQLLD